MRLTAQYAGLAAQFAEGRDPAKTTARETKRTADQVTRMAKTMAELAAKVATVSSAETRVLKVTGA